MLLFNALHILLACGTVQALPYLEKRKSSKALKWAPCELEFPKSVNDTITSPIDCATLEVPLDYTNAKSESLKLQLIRVSATKPSSSKRKSVIFSPGGPGGSGVEEIATKGSLYRDTLGGSFDIIGFDPRGIGRTIPFACDVNLSDANSSLSRRSNITVNIPQRNSYEFLEEIAWKDGKYFADACYESQKDNGPYLSTAFVARDLNNIVKALDEDGLLRFWGRSYGTIIGQTYASMFPNTIDRLVLDSVVLPLDYHSGYWITATRDTADTLANAFSECIDAGSEICPLAVYNGADTVPEDLSAAFADSLQELIENPVSLPDNFTALRWFQPGHLTLYDLVKMVTLNQLYRPDQLQSVLYVAGQTIARNWTGLADELVQAFSASSDEVPWSLGVDAFAGVACSDGSFRAKSPADLYSLVNAQTLEGMFADTFSPQVWVCAHWRLDAKERYEGNFRNINTSFPALFVNNLHDPITPLSGAMEAAAGFVGSRLLQQNGHGHGLMNHPSNCTMDALREYFEDGTLPKAGTKCEPNQSAMEISIEYLEQIGSGNSQ